MSPERCKRFDPITEALTTPLCPKCFIQDLCFRIDSVNDMYMKGEISNEELTSVHISASKLPTLYSHNASKV